MLIDDVVAPSAEVAVPAAGVAELLSAAESPPQAVMLKAIAPRSSEEADIANFFMSKKSVIK